MNQDQNQDQGYILHPGRTYTLTDHRGDPSSYFRLIRELADHFLSIIPGAKNLRSCVRAAHPWYRVLSNKVRNRACVTQILTTLDKELSPFLTGIDEHLKRLSLPDRLDRTLRMGKEKYLLAMLEIELTNRINRDRFRQASWQMALIAHCLKDYRDQCRSVPGQIEELCVRCNKRCFVCLGSEMLERFGIVPYISATMDHKKLLSGLRKERPDMGVLGIACVPELVAGLRLCERLDLPAVGIPLNANRCSRWMDRSLETTFSLEELEKLISPVSGV